MIKTKHLRSQKTLSNNNKDIINVKCIYLWEQLWWRKTNHNCESSQILDSSRSLEMKWDASTMLPRIYCLFVSFWCRSQPLGGVFARPWSRSSSQQRELHKTTRRCLPLRRWWTAWLSSPSRPPASPLCSSVWLKSPPDILRHRSRDKGLFTLHAVLSFLFEMPYFVIDSCHFSATQRSSLEPWHECWAVTELGFDCWLCPRHPTAPHLSVALPLCVNLLNIWGPVVALIVFAFFCSFALLCFGMFLPSTW